jgi:hypothetical protein
LISIRPSGRWRYQAQAVAATLASVAAKTRANPRTRHLDLTDMDKAVT